MVNYSFILVDTSYFCLMWFGISGMVRTSTSLGKERVEQIPSLANGMRGTETPPQDGDKIIFQSTNCPVCDRLLLTSSKDCKKWWNGALP